MRGLQSPLFIGRILGMINKAIIEQLVQEKLEELPYFVVDIQVSSSNVIRVEIDGDKGVNIADCVKISRHIEGSFDREEQDFELTVSSAGMDQPFKILRQYQRYVGRDVEVKLTDGSKQIGKLLSASEEEIKIETTRRERIPGKKKKQTIVEEIVFPMDTIKETKVVISFK